MNCHLVIPNLFLPESAGAEPYRDLALPALETLLARGSHQRLSGMSLERWLAAAFRIASRQDLPLAPINLRGDGVDPGRACWVQADPVHLKVYRDQLLLVDASCFEITRDEAAAMTAALSAHFSADGIEFIAPVAQRWYARVRAEPRMLTTPTVETAGRGVEPFLPAGDDGPGWRRIANEAQMLLHGHPLNEAREQRGDLPINSVWFWGTGRLADISATAPYAAVWSADPLSLGLAGIAGVPAHSLPRTGSQLLDSLRAIPDDRPQLIVIDELRAAVCGDAAAWRSALEDLEQRWFAPLLRAVKGRALQALTLYALGPDHSLSATYTRLDQYKLWQSRRPLIDHSGRQP